MWNFSSPFLLSYFWKCVRGPGYSIGHSEEITKPQGSSGLLEKTWHETVVISVPHLDLPFGGWPGQIKIRHMLQILLLNPCVQLTLDQCGDREHWPPPHTHTELTVCARFMTGSPQPQFLLIQGPSVSVVPPVPLAPYSQVQTTEDPVVFTAEKTVLTGGPV